MNRDKLVELGQKVLELIEANDCILIFGHKDADGDTLGCSLAFEEALRARGKSVSVVIPPPLPQQYGWLPGFDRITDRPRDGIEPGLVLFFDAANLERSGSAADSIPDRATIVNVDHHPSNDRFGDVNIIDPDAAAVAEMVVAILESWKWEITPEMATNLYTALVTDTGGFRHENTDADALETAARLARYGVEPSFVTTMVYKSRPLTTLRLNALCMAAMQVEFDGRLAWTKVTRRMLQDAGAVMAETEDLIDTLNTIADLDMAIVFKEVRDNQTKISVRSRGRVDAARFCSQFGGGGHSRAAGAEVDASMHEAIDLVLAAARQAIAGNSDAVGSPQPQ
ncbi:MAG TPA: bifunctional oligoribonuclease/PAP phosphatase NrnA [Candidatus Dormibacteraeota bacterium]